MRAPDRAVADLSYATRARDLEQRRDELGRQARIVAGARLALFAGAVALVLAALGRPDANRPVLWSGAALAAAVFAFLVGRHARLQREHERFRALAALNRDAIRRVARDWSVVDDHNWPATPAGHPYADDLDVFGPASLARLFPPVSSVPGRPTLRAWLLGPAAHAELLERQRAVAELAPLIELRDELAIRAGRVRIAPKRADRFIAWAEEPGWLAARPWLVGATRLLPIATVALGAADAVGATSRPLWWLPVLAGATLTAVYRGPLAQTLRDVLPEAEVLAQYASLFEAAATAPLVAPLLRRVQQAMGAEGAVAHQQLARLRALADAAETRRSPMLHIPIQLVTLWDFHIVFLLERWRRRAGRGLRDRMAALGEMEALSAIATLAHDNPGWVFPDLAPEGPARLEARSLGHPLLPPDAVVPNDVVVGPPGCVLLVTGSNMAGKSTLIRAIGLNVVLAQCGAPVCAQWMRCSPVELHTSIRVHDSLARGVSYFMAELERLKTIVDAARIGTCGGGRTLLYLLDEILQGTNSAERTIAARRVLAHLVRAKAIGAVTTHDLALAEADPRDSSGAAEQLRNAAVPVHFAEQFTDGPTGPAMTFDYTLRSGVATSTNALKLLEIVGLATGDDTLP